LYESELKLENIGVSNCLQKGGCLFLSKYKLVLARQILNIHTMLNHVRDSGVKTMPYVAQSTNPILTDHEGNSVHLRVSEYGRKLK
jgi:hypothetical protein